MIATCDNCKRFLFQKATSTILKDFGINPRLPTLDVDALIELLSAVKHLVLLPREYFYGLQLILIYYNLFFNFCDALAKIQAYNKRRYLVLGGIKLSPSR